MSDDAFTDTREDNTLCHAVDEDYIAISRRMFEANEGNPVNLEDVLQPLSLATSCPSHHQRFTSNRS